MNIAADLKQIESIVARARAAQGVYAQAPTQQRYDNAAQAVAWAIMEPTRNRALAELAVKTTGLGNVPDKITKNHRKTLGLMRDISSLPTCGIIAEYSDRGISEIARPIGVVGAVVPSTNPAATPANNAINALKCGNAIVLSPSPKGEETCSMLIEYIYNEFDKVGIDHHLVQMITPPGSKEKTQRLLEITDLVVVTGSQNNVKRAYSCGTPAVAVGVGNATVIVDETADLANAAKKIKASKIFDNATSCSSENALVVVDSIYDDFVTAMGKTGGVVVEDEQSIVKKLWQDGKLNRDVIGKDADRLLAVLDLADRFPDGAEYLAVATSGIGADHPLSGEKMSRILALYRVRDFAEAVEVTAKIQQHQGAGHSVGIHTSNDARAISLGYSIPTSRVIVNQAHCFATGGAFNNGMPFSLSMGCGSWGSNSIDENLHWKHFMQTTKIVREIPPRQPKLEEIFGNYWNQFGK